MTAAFGWVCAKYGHDAYLDAVPRRLNRCLTADPVPAVAWLALGLGPLLQLLAGFGAVRQLRGGPSTATTVAAAVVAVVAAVLLVFAGYGLADAIGGLDHPHRTCTGL